MDIDSRVGDVVSTGPLAELLREDLATANRCWGRPGLHALWVYRIGRWARQHTGPAALAARLAHRIVNVAVIRNVYGMEVSAEAAIGRRVLIGHHQAVQIPPLCVIGDGTVIRHNVNIGFGGSDTRREDVPHIGRDVQLGSGCCVLGPVTVGDGARIGPNAVVMSNVAPGATVFAPPPRTLKAPVRPDPAVAGGPGPTVPAGGS